MLIRRKLAVNFNKVPSTSDPQPRCGFHELPECVGTWKQQSARGGHTSATPAAKVWDKRIGSKSGPNRVHGSKSGPNRVQILLQSNWWPRKSSKVHKHSLWSLNTINYHCRPAVCSRKLVWTAKQARLARIMLLKVTFQGKTGWFRKWTLKKVKKFQVHCFIRVWKLRKSFVNRHQSSSKHIWMGLAPQLISQNYEARRV